MADIYYAKTAAELKVAVDRLASSPDNSQYGIMHQLSWLLQKKALITNAPTADSVVNYLRISSREHLQNEQIRDLFVSDLAPKISQGIPTENFGATICNIIQDKPAADLYATAETFKAILACFHRVSSPESARWISGALRNVLCFNPTANELLNNLPVVEALSAVIPHATDNESVESVSSLVEMIIDNNPAAEKLVATSSFIKTFKTMSKVTPVPQSFETTLDVIQTLLQSSLLQSLSTSSNPNEFAAALTSIVNDAARDPQLLDAAHSRRDLIKDQRTAVAAARFLKWCGAGNAASIAIPEVYTLLQNNLLPFTVGASSVVFEVILSIINAKKEARDSFSSTSFRDVCEKHLANPNLPLLRVLHSLLSNNNSKAIDIFGTPDFYRRFKSSTLEQCASTAAARKDLDAVLCTLRISCLRRSQTPAQLKDAVAELPHTESYFTKEIRDILLQRQGLMTDAATMDAVIAFLHAFGSNSSAKWEPLQTKEIGEMVVNILNSSVKHAKLEMLSESLWSITFKCQSACGLFSSNEALKGILGCCIAAKTSETARWFVGVLHNILFFNPAANKLLNTLPVVEAMSAILDQTSSEEGAKWVSHTLQKIINNNDESKRLFGTVAFLEKVENLTKRAKSISSNTAFTAVCKSIRSSVEGSLQQALTCCSTSQELTAALNNILKVASFWSALVELLLSKKHFIQDEASTIAAAKFISFATEKEKSSVSKNKIYLDLFHNILLPKSHIHKNALNHVYDSLSNLINNNKEGKEFFSTLTFRYFFVTSLPHADESVIKVLSALLPNNKKAQQIFGTPTLLKKLSSKFPNNTTSTFSNVMKIINDNIFEERVEPMKKLVQKFQESDIDDECLTLLARFGIAEPDFLKCDSAIFLAAGVGNSVLPLMRLQEKMKNGGSPVAQHVDPAKMRESEQLRTEHDDLRKKHQALIDELQSANSNLDSAKLNEARDREAQQAKLTQVEKEKQEVTTQLATEKSETKTLRQQKSTLEAEKKQLETDLAKEKLQHAQNLQAQKSAADSERRVAEQRLSDERQQHAKLLHNQKLAADKEKADVQLLLAKEKKQTSNLQKSLDDTIEKLNHSINNNKQLTQQVAEWTARHKKAADDCDHLQKQKNEFGQQIALLSAIIPGKWHQFNYTFNGLPQPTGVELKHAIDSTSPIFAVAEQLMRKGGALVYDASSPNDFKHSPVKGFTLQSMEVIVRECASFEARMKRLPGLRTANAKAVDPVLAALSPDQQSIAKALGGQFLPRSSGADVKAPELVNVFHGTKIDCLESVIEGLHAMKSTDQGFFGFGVYTTTSIEYAAQYARGDFGHVGQASSRGGCYPVLWCVAAVGDCYPVSRANDYSKNRVDSTFGKVSDFFGAPLKAGFDCHCAVVSCQAGCQAVDSRNMEYMEIVFDQESQVIPIAVLWVKPK